MRLLVTPLQALYSIWSYAVFALLVTLGAIAYSLIALAGSRHAEWQMVRVNNFIASLWGLLSAVRMKVEMHPDLQRDKVYVLLGNHSSTLDMLIGAFGMRFAVRYLGKAELARLPVLGFMFRRACILVDRADPNSRRESLRQMREVALRGVSVCILPEGTRNRSREPLLPFHKGAFRLAVDAQLPIAPFVILGANKLMPMGSWMLRPGLMRLRYLAPIPTEGLGDEDVSGLVDHVWTLMRSAIATDDPQRWPSVSSDQYQENEL